MSLLTTHRYLYGNIDLTSAEADQLTKLSSAVLSAPSDEAAQEILSALLESASDAALFKIANTIDIFSQIETSEKRADFARIAHGIAALLSTVPVLSELGRIGSQYAGRQSSLKEVLVKHPELKDDPDLDKYVKLVTTFSPQVASNEILLGHVLSNLHRMGRENVTPETIKNLVEFEVESRKTRGELPKQVGQFGERMMDIQKGFRPGKDKKDKGDGSTSFGFGN